MANPTASTGADIAHDFEGPIKVTQILNSSGVVVGGAAQKAHIADTAACAAMTFAAGSIDTGTDMTAAEAAAIVADLAALKTAVDNLNATQDSILVALEDHGLVADS